ncbi:MAG TPA: amidase [Xanthobacteraceae bacterium]|nr:amidase [Xanthobacteraceae bacterium]
MNKNAASPVFATAREQLRLLREKKIGAAELLDLTLARVRSANPGVNAVIAFDEDRARRDAKRADKAAANGQSLGALHGLPMTVKDVFEMEGVVTTCGIPALRDYVPKQDALMLTQLRDAGAVIYGKTNVPEGAGDHQSYNAIYGITRNPWNLDVTAGGSSGGAAAAVATFMTSLEVGSDVGGSIRCPAHFCGTFGLKPSHGLVPLIGHIPPEPGALRDIEMEVAGPLARSAYDLETLFDVIAVPNDLDRKGKRWDLPKARKNKLEDFRVALWADTKHYPVDPGYLNAVHAFADDLRRAGVTIDDKARPEIDPDESNETYIATLFGMWGGGLSEEAFQGYIRASVGLDPADKSWPARIGRAAAQSLRDWDRLQEKRAKIRRAWEAFFRDYDVLLCPVMVTPAFPHDTSGADHTAQLHRTMQVGGERLPYLDNLIWPGLITLASLPSAVAPTRHFTDGLPTGIQIVSGFLEDRTTLRFAQLVEEEFGGFIAPDEKTYVRA